MIRGHTSTAVIVAVSGKRQVSGDTDAQGGGEYPTFFRLPDCPSDASQAVTADGRPRPAPTPSLPRRRHAKTRTQVKTISAIASVCITFTCAHHDHFNMHIVVFSWVLSTWNKQICYIMLCYVMLCYVSWATNVGEIHTFIYDCAIHFLM